MKNNEKKQSARTPTVYRKLEDVVGCKWSVSVLVAVRQGVNRPGLLEQTIEGISKKVLSERLRKLSAYGLLRKHVYPEVPPRTEYTMTKSGEKLALIVEQIQLLDEQLSESKTSENKIGSQ
ncbi:winged helix-turn-helix transcriptional regulator [Teredinibacter turnerae]|uniref:winged helix-turn-helix transcriptional regulator n=1 Tax=Teredinibacter turnerae TaxID=2426 RepID=UPI00036CD905|nr:helix-turn-helix domain-containing protein [Teredinibacter turnerae]